VEFSLISRNLGKSLPVILTLFLFSGATSLVYEVIWLRQLILIFGSTQFATSTVLSTFMGGLALGAIVAGRWLGSSRVRPLKIYGLLEIGIGLYALAVPFLFASLTPIYRALWAAGASESFMLLSLAKFAGIACVLLPPTILMGASLPVLAREVADDPRRIGGKVGLLYAINTFGAVAGTFIAGFVAIPGIGSQKTLWLTAAANLMIGLAAMWFARSLQAVRMPTETRAPAAREAGRTPGRIRLVLLAFGLSGFSALVLEVSWTRVLALVMGSSVYAFSLMLVAFLIGLATGGAYFSAFLRKRPDTDPAVVLALLLAAAGILAYATTFLFQMLPQMFAEVFYAWRPGPNGWFVVQFVFGLMVMFPATFAFGGIFPTVLQIHARSLDKVAGSVGTVYASNTLGTIIGAALAGFVLIPQLGVQPTVIAIAGLEILLGLVIAVAAVAKPVPLRSLLAVPMALALALVVAVQPEWDVRLMNSGVYMNLYGDYENEDWATFLDAVHGNNEVRYAAEGLTASVFVAEQPEYENLYLSVNGKIEASTTSDLETQLMCAHLPLLLHPSPSDVLIIGLASGISVGAAATHPVENLRVVEVEKKMIPAARLFEDYNDHVLDDPRLTLSINDARNELEFSPRTYDVIISEPSNPWMTVAANLFTEDFFHMARTRVRPGGIFSQWIQNYYLPAEDLRSIVAAFRSAFPNVLLFETFGGVDLLMLGSEEPLTLDLETIETRMAELKVRMDLGRIEMRRAVDVLTLFRLGTDEVEQLVAGAPRNTDDNARVEFSAPKTLGLYTLEENLALLRQYTADPLSYVTPPLEDPLESDRLRLSLAEAWFWRGDYDLAAESARRVSEGPLRVRAEEILQEVEIAETNL
jgi:spermidine synthase